MPSPLPRIKAGLDLVRKGVSLAWGGGDSSGFGLQSQIAAATTVGGIPLSDVIISTDSLYTLWRNNGDVFGCIRELGQSVGVNGWYWENKINPDQDPNQQSVRRAESVFTAYQTMRQFFKELVQDVSISGNTYYHLEKSKGNGQVIAMCRIDPRSISVVTDKYGTILRWIQRVAGQTAVFTEAEVAHFILTHDPNSPVFGIAPMEPILWDVRTDLAANISNYSLFMNDGTPSAMYVFEDQMNDDQITKAVERLREQLKGPGNRHKATAIKGLKEIQTVSISPKDMEFVVLRQMTTEKVCAAFGVP